MRADAVTLCLRRPESPAIQITVPLEGKATTRIEARPEGEQLRAVDWACADGRVEQVLGEVRSLLENLGERHGRAA